MLFLIQLTCTVLFIGWTFFSGPSLGSHKPLTVPTSQWTSLRARIIGFSAIEISLTLLVSYGALWIIQHDLLSRLKTLSEKTRLIDYRPDTGLGRKFGASESDMLEELDIFVSRLCQNFQSENDKRQDYFAMLAHDLRAPLAQVTFLLGMLADGAYDSDEQVRKLKIRKILPEVGRVTRLIEDALTLRKLASDKLLLAKEPTVLLGLLQEIKDALENECWVREVQMEIRCHDADMLIDCDVFEVKRVLINLCSNSLKQSPKGTTISLVTAYSDIADFVRIEIQDQGPGIPDDLKSRLFEPYHQGQDATTKLGFGLGLSIARLIVQEHGGEIGIRDRDDDSSGAIVFFTLPKCPEVS